MPHSLNQFRNNKRLPIIAHIPWIINLPGSPSQKVLHLEGAHSKGGQSLLNLVPLVLYKLTTAYTLQPTEAL